MTPPARDDFTTSADVAPNSQRGTNDEKKVALRKFSSIFFNYREDKVIPWQFFHGQYTCRSTFALYTPAVEKIEEGGVNSPSYTQRYIKTVCSSYLPASYGSPLGHFFWYSFFFLFFSDSESHCSLSREWGCRFFACTFRVSRCALPTRVLRCRC